MLDRLPADERLPSEEQLPPAATQASTHVAEPVPQVAFLVSPRTDVYQPIVRMLFEARQASRMALTSVQVAAELERREGVRFHAVEHLDAYLRQLYRWRVVERAEQHAVEYSSLEEYYRGRVTWDLTDAAAQVSRFLEAARAPRRRRAGAGGVARAGSRRRWALARGCSGKSGLRSLPRVHRLLSDTA